MPENITPARPPGVSTPGVDVYAGQQPQSEPASSEQAERLKSSATDRARTEAEKHKQGLASDLKKVSSTLESSRGELENAGWTGKLLSEAAGQLQRVAETLERRSPDDLLHDLRGYARTNPAVYLAGCAAVGFAASRVARAEPEGGRHGNA